MATEKKEAAPQKDNTQSMLSEPFPREVERQLRKGGTTLTYIPVSEVIARLNKVFGYDNWSFEIIECKRDAIDSEFIVAHVAMYIRDGQTQDKIRKDGFGGQKIKRTKTGEIVDLGDDFKGAVSDALKKAAQTLGIGLYLARSEEALYAESLDAVNPEIDELWSQFVELSKSITAEQKKSLGDYWNEYSGGRSKPTKQTATTEDLNVLIQWCLMAHMEG